MAYKRKRSSSKRPTKRARIVKRRTRGRVARSRRFDPFPTQKTVLMRYASNFILDATIGTPGSYIFRCASIYDPDFSGTGHQPYGHDQWQAVYNHYEVLSSKITVRAQSSSPGSNTASGVIGIAIKDDTTYETNFDTIREAKDSHFKFLPGYGPASTSVTARWSKNKYWPRGSSPNTRTAFGSNPNDDMFFVVYTTAITPALEAPAVQCLVNMEFVVRMFEPKDLGQS